MYHILSYKSCAQVCQSLIILVAASAAGENFAPVEAPQAIFLDFPTPQRRFLHSNQSENEYKIRYNSKDIPKISPAAPDTIYITFPPI